MSPEVSLLNEVWEIVREQINKKERVAIAEAILRTFEEHVDIEDIDVYKNEFDGVMKTAIISVYEDEDEDEEDDDWG